MNGHLGADIAVQESQGKLSDYIPPTLRERMTKIRAEFSRKIEEIDATLRLMDENPGFEKVHDAIAKLNLGLR